MSMKGIVAFSFAQRAESDEPGPCNVRIAEAVATIVRKQSEPVMIVAQWEVNRELERLGVTVQHVVRPHEGQYLDSEQVWKEAAAEFSRIGIKRVTPVAQPFLQLAKVNRLIRKDNFSVLRERIGFIGFDRSEKNLQWWTKGRCRLIAYSLLQLATGRGGIGMTTER